MKDFSGSSQVVELRQQFAFPLFVRLDDGEVMQIESYDKILYHLEAIDIENDEYLFWDANGNGVKVLINSSRIEGLQPTNNAVTVQEAISAYSSQLGVAIENSRTPQDAWARLLRVKGMFPPQAHFLSRIFRRWRNRCR